MTKRRQSFPTKTEPTEPWTTVRYHVNHYSAGPGIPRSPVIFADLEKAILWAKSLPASPSAEKHGLWPTVERVVTTSQRLVEVRPRGRK